MYYKQPRVKNQKVQTHLMKSKTHPQVKVVSAMTFRGKNGNAAGVVLDAEDISPAQRQEMAAKAGYSETAFLEKINDGSYALSFFTPTRSIAYCGHATIATFAYLRMMNIETRDTVEVKISDSTLRIYYDGDIVFMEQKTPKYERLSEEHESAVLSSLNLGQEQLDSIFSPQIVDTGNRFILVSVRDRHTIMNLVPNHTKIKKLSEKLNLIGFYVFLRTPGVHAATSRMFAPLYGIPEESATGMAAGPLAAALVDVFGLQQKKIHLLQGEFMSPSQASEIIAHLEIKDSKVVRLKVGGRASF